LTTGTGHHVEERSAVTDVAALGEVRFEQRLDHRVLHSPLAGRPDQPVGVEDA